MVATDPMQKYILFLNFKLIAPSIPCISHSFTWKSFVSVRNKFNVAACGKNLGKRYRQKLEKVDNTFNYIVQKINYNCDLKTDNTAFFCCNTG